MKDYYGTLGVKKTSSKEDIKTAFKALSIKYHPDKNPDDAQSEDKFKEVAEAYKKNVGERVTLALRPEKIMLEAFNEGSTQGFTGKIEDSVYIGTDTTYHISLNEETQIAARGQNTITGEARFKPGDRVTVKVGRGAARILVD